MMRRIGTIAVVVLVAVASSGCEDNSADSPQPTAQSPEAAQATQQQPGETDEPGEEGAALAPDPTDGVDAEPRRATLTIPQAREQSDDGSAVRISAAETTEIPLHEQPDRDSEIVDRVEFEEDEVLSGHISLMVADVGLNTAEAPASLQVTEVDPDGDDVAPRASTEEIEEGDQIAVIDFFLGACGGSTYYVWHNDRTYRVHHESREDIPDRDSDAYFHYEGYPDSPVSDDEWWGRLEGPNEKGWLLIDADEWNVDRVPHEEMMPREPADR